MRPGDTALAGGDDSEFSGFGKPETDEELFARARAHMEKYSAAASLDRRLWDATVRIAMRGYVDEPFAWAVFASDTHELIDVTIIKPESENTVYAEPLYKRRGD